jgi:hypothetical protein
MRLIILALLAASLDAQIMPQVRRVVGQSHTDFTKDAACVGAWLMNGPDKEQDISGHGATLSRVGTGLNPYLQAAFASGFGGLSKYFSTSAVSALSSPDGSSLDIGGPTAKISIVCRIKPDSVAANNDATIFAKYETTTNQRQYCLFIHAGSTANQYQLSTYISGSGTSATTIASTVTNYATGADHCVAFTSDNAHLNLYVDGSVAATPVTYSAGIYSGTATTYFGRRNSGTTNSFSGSMDDCAVFSRALTLAEVSSICSYGVNGRKGQAEGTSLFTGYTNSAGTILSLDDLNATVDALCTANGWTCTSLGQSAQGRDIKTVVISGGATPAYTIVIDGGTHGDEKRPVMIVLDLLRYLAENKQFGSNVRWVITPARNPDGYVFGSRKNNNTPAGRAVDLNRNFTQGWGATPCMAGETPGSSTPGDPNYKGPSAESEPETTVAKAIISTYTPKYHISLHEPEGAFLGQTGLSTGITGAMNLGVLADGSAAYGITTGPACGTYKDYAITVSGVASWEHEIADVNAGATYSREANRAISAIRALVAAQP